MALVALCHGVSGTIYRVRGSILTNDILDDLSALDPETRVIVNGGENAAYVMADGSFVVNGVREGESLLEVLSHKYEFPKIRLSIGTNEEGRASVAPRFVQPGHEWSTDAPTIEYPLKIQAINKHEFVVPREGFNIIGLFMNPYMLMIGASLVLVLIVPKLQANMDPEVLQDSSKQYQAMTQADISETLTNFLMGGQDPKKISNKGKASRK
ncbi:hypothetical protein EV182_004584 [Spiromyces aspiralis]|uniref:Uncharacterized protein n=1 Tax=Spiromyces aspiralis TaxID=68401 RepID=A0ACC1HC83_9FUNG|nr:hypothetical protein EV182_004584 [Spiromyces aspiralis]